MRRTGMCSAAPTGNLQSRQQLCGKIGVIRCQASAAPAAVTRRQVLIHLQTCAVDTERAPDAEGAACKLHAHGERPSAGPLRIWVAATVPQPFPQDV